jgi:hypothetical protein
MRRHVHYGVYVGLQIFGSAKVTCGKGSAYEGNASKVPKDDHETPSEK